MSVLCYHTVEPGWSSGLAMEPATFRDHCAWLARNRHVVDLDTAIALMDRRGNLPGRVSCLTFDDGLAGLHEHALPVLRSFRLPATVFVVAKTIAGEPAVDWIDDPPEHPLQTLDVAQLQEMLASGIQVASHSRTHRVLPGLEPEDLGDDLTSSREILEDRLGAPVRHLAYPRGRHDAAVRAAAERAGYSHAFALPEGPEPVGPYSLPRVGVYRHNGVPTVRLKSARGYRAMRTNLLPRGTALLGGARPRRADTRGRELTSGRPSTS